MDWNALIRVYIQVPQKSLNTFIINNDSLLLFVNNLKEAITQSFNKLEVSTQLPISNIFELIKEELSKEDIHHWLGREIGSD